MSDPAFATSDDEPFSVYTQWIETDFVNDIPAWSGATEELPAPASRDTVVVEVQGKRIEVTMPSIVGGGAAAGRRPAGPSAPPKRRSSGVRGGLASSGSVTSPMQATVVKVAVAEGDTVVKGDLLVVLEAMKMEQPVQGTRDGVSRR
ncbi:biotin/lipoyl-containing protein [Curtobacterium sp. B8]|uniref:biotin/lipoyl-containing protein n=1 Tax=Curtobacterium sp. B8 TaxID=95611 RepID=UPI0003B55ED8